MTNWHTEELIRRINSSEMVVEDILRHPNKKRLTARLGGMGLTVALDTHIMWLDSSDDVVRIVDAYLDRCALLGVSEEAALEIFPNLEAFLEALAQADSTMTVWHEFSVRRRAWIDEVVKPEIARRAAERTEFERGVDRLLAKVEFLEVHGRWPTASDILDQTGDDF